RLDRQDDRRSTVALRIHARIRLHRPDRVSTSSLTMSVSICSVSIDIILPLRHRILREGLPFESARFEGDEEPASRHFAAWDGERVVGCVSVHRRALDAMTPVGWQLRGMA